MRSKITDTKLLHLLSAFAMASTISACDGDNGDDGAASGTESGLETMGADESAGDDADSDSGESAGDASDASTATADADTSADASAGDDTAGDDSAGDTADESAGETGEGCALPDPGWGSSAAVGAPAPHFTAPNQDGDIVNICELAGIPIAIDTSAMWCGPCQRMSMCLMGPQNNAECIQMFGGDPAVIDQLIDPLRAAIADHTFAWVTVLMENEGGGPPAQTDAATWDSNFPNPDIWVMSDSTQQYFQHLPIGAFPNFFLIGSDLSWQDLNQQSVFGTIIGLL